MASTLHKQKIFTKRNVVPEAETAIASRKNQQRAHLTTLSSLDCLYAVAAKELEQLAELCTFRAFEPGTTVISERKPSEFLYLLLQGNLRLTAHDKDGHEGLLGILGRGDCCGEGPLFGDFFRRTGAYAETRCYALQLNLANLRALLPAAPLLNAALQRIYRRRLVESTLARVPLFRKLSSLERLVLAEMLQPIHYQRGSVIVHQGQRGSALYLIEAGQVIVEQDGRTIAHLDEGDFFGEMALLCDQPHNANVQTLTPTTVLALPAVDFERLLDQRPDLKAQLTTVVEQRRANSQALRNDLERVRRLELVVQHGLLRGSHLLVRRPELCSPDCQICEMACAARHGQTRLRLNGVTVGDLDMVDTCRQCRVGAECIEACPENAFEWNDRGALIINDRCTGCGECLPACPYGAITRVPTTISQPSGPLWQLWHAMKRLRSPTLIDPEPVQHSHRADKCDMCHGYDDLACVSACPTGSLRLVPVEELFPL